MAKCTTDDTDILLDRIRGGDEGAVSRLLDRQRGRLGKMLRFRMDRRLLRRLDPSDVVQESLLAAAAKIHAYVQEPQLDFYPWLRDIAIRRLIDLHRHHIIALRRSTDREFDPTLSDASTSQLAASLLDIEAEPWQLVSRSELRNRVRTAMTQLSSTAREVLVLRFVELLTTREAAQVLGLSESAFKGRQVRALLKLRSLLTEDGSGAYWDG